MRAWCLGLLNVATVASAQSAADTTARVRFGGFIDTYYAWDFGRPPTVDRSFAGGTLFTTQPARHNEFNVNLVFLEARLESRDVRGRIAFQAGTSVQSNYAGEPAIGSVSGPGLTQHIQEAVGGARLASGLWVDAGVFFSHLGMESWISRDNLTYTRSLVAEYSPYYQSGAKLTWTSSPRLEAQVVVVNGWQNVSENNGGKGVGARLDWRPSEGAVLSYYNLVSQEAGSRLRSFHGIGARASMRRVTLLGQLDAGSQNESTAEGRPAWWVGYAGIARLQTTAATGIVIRVESYSDPDQVIVGTGSVAGTPNVPLRAAGGSLGVDVRTRATAIWRTELRGFRNSRAIFPGGNGPPTHDGGFLVTSLALTL